MASSDSIIRNTYRQVTGSEAPESVINSARNIPDNELASYFSGSGGGGSNYASSGDPATDFIGSILDEITKPLKEANDRAAEYDKNNPFFFDEVLAKQSAEERLNPYYEAELKDFITGVERARGRTTEDEEKLRQELVTTGEQVGGRLQRDLEETIRSTQEGFSGVNLLTSGSRLREEGKQEVVGQENIDQATTGNEASLEASKKRQSRTLEDLLSKENTYRRQQTAAQETDLTTDVEQQRKEQSQQYELGRQNYIGYPLAGGTSSLSSILGI